MSQGALIIVTLPLNALLLLSFPPRKPKLRNGIKSIIFLPSVQAGTPFQQQLPSNWNLITQVIWITTTLILKHRSYLHLVSPLDNLHLAFFRNSCSVVLPT